MRLLDAIRDIVLMVHPDGRIADANEAAVEAYGYARDELRSMRIVDLRAPESLSAAADQMNKANAEGILFETIHRRKDGSKFPVEVSSKGMDLDSERLLLSVVRDISERKRSEAALRESEQFLNRTLLSLRDAVFVIDAETIEVKACNPAVSEIFGYAPEEVIGRTTTFLHADEATLDEFRRHLSSAVADKGYLHLPEFVMRRKDGTVFPTDHSVMPVEDDAGKRIGWVSVVRDISERKRIEAERERLLSETRLWAVHLDAVIENTDAQFALLDANFRFVMVNSAYVAACGHSREELLGRGHFEFFPDEENEAIFRRVLETGKVFRVMEKPFEYADQPERGVSYWNWILVPIEGDDGIARGLLLSLVDVTPQVLARRKVEGLAEEAARQAAELDTILSSIPDGLVVYGMNGEVLRVNTAAREVMEIDEKGPGRSFEERISRLPALTAEGTPFPTDALPVRRALQGETVLGVIMDIRLPDRRAWMSASAAPIVSSQGIQIGAVLSVTDVTAQHELEAERKQAEERLRDSELKYRSLYQSMSEGVVLHEIVHDELGNAVDYRLLEGNPAFEKITGLSCEQVCGELASRVYGTGYAPYLDIYAGVAETGEAVSFETTFAPMQKSFAISVFSPSKGKFATVFQDITGRKRADADRERFTAQIRDLARVAEHRASELETAIQSMADAVFVCDKQGSITLANEAALSLVGSEGLPEGYSLADYLGNLRLSLRDGRVVEKKDLAISRALAGETVRQKEEVGIHPVSGAEIDLLISAAPIRDDAGSVVGAVEVARDVTELMELDRLKEQFISVAAHELKTPVTVMKGFAQLLLRRQGWATPEHRRVLERIDEGANRIDGIVQAILDVSLFSSDQVKLSMEGIDLGEFVAQKVDAAALANPKHQYRLMRADHAVVQADPDRLEQVLETLLDNAARYSPSGREIEIEVEGVDGRAMVSVKDHGIGIPEKKQGRIFQRFYRAHSGTPYDYGGLGVGLYIAREIILLHGGSIHFESEEGKGSTFRFGLPTGGKGARV